MKTRIAAHAEDRDLMAFFFKNSGEDISYVADLKKRLVYVFRSSHTLWDAYVRHIVVILKNVSRRSEIVVLRRQKSGDSSLPRRSNSTSTDPSSEIPSPLYHPMLKHCQTNSSRRRPRFKDFSCSISNTNKLVTFNPMQTSYSRCRLFLGRIIVVHRVGEVICCLGSAGPPSEEQSPRSFCHGGKALKE